MHRVRSVISACAAAGLVLWGAPAAGALPEQDPNAFRWSEEYVPSGDGTLLHAYVFRPAHVPEDERTPVILTVTPYAGSGGTLLAPDPARQGDPQPGSFASLGRVFERGYAYVVVSLRGFGASEGCYDLGGAGEQADVEAAVRWAASRPWSTGRVGLRGHSYEAWTQVMALARRPEGLEAVVMTGPPSGYRTWYMNRVRNAFGGHGLGAFYLASDLLPPSVFAPAEQWGHTIRGTAGNPACYPLVTAGTFDPDPASPFWRERDVLSRAAGTTVPALYVQGFDDWNVRPTTLDPLWKALRGPKRGWFGPWDHGIPGLGEMAFVEEAMRWFDRYLKHGPDPGGPRVQLQLPDGRWHAEADWPPPDAIYHPLPVRPGTYLDAAGNASETDLPAQFPLRSPLALPGGRGTWTFTQPLPYPVQVAGLPRLTVTVEAAAPVVNLVAILYDLSPANGAAYVSRGAYLAPGTGTYTFELYPNDWRFETGHRIGILLTGADDLWFEPGKTATPVRVGGGTLELPAMAFEREFADQGPFRPRPAPAPLTVDPQTVEGATVPAELPPPMRRGP